MLDEVKKLHARLMAMPPVKRDNLNACDFPGVYLFSENGKSLYCGRTRKLNERLLQHSRSRPEGATFAFRLARRLTGNLKADYKPGARSRAGLMKDGRFVEVFNRQRKRIARMDIRYVRVADPTIQALLEIYTSTVLRTPHNEFKTT